MPPYATSKTLAEHCAWKFRDSKDISLTTIHHGMVLGPAIETDYVSSLAALVNLLQQEIPLLPRFGF